MEPIKVFIPVNKGKIKSLIRGFWYSSETKKTFYDYLRLSNRFNLTAELEAIQKRYNQEAIAYIDKSELKIFYNAGKIEILKKSVIIRHSGFKNLKDIIKSQLKKYGGVTVYIKDNNTYIIEAFYN